MSPVRLVPSHDSQLVLSLLRDAEEGDARILAALEDPASVSYLAYAGNAIVGAVLVHWADDASEIIYIAVTAPQRGQGYGRAMIGCIVDEALQRGTAALLVGTANAGLDNIAFYQKCGFRMDSVRRDYFDYFAEPVYENGIQIRDMLVFRLSLKGANRTTSDPV